MRKGVDDLLTGYIVTMTDTTTSQKSADGLVVGRRSFWMMAMLSMMILSVAPRTSGFVVPSPVSLKTTTVSKHRRAGVVSLRAEEQNLETTGEESLTSSSSLRESLLQEYVSVLGQIESIEKSLQETEESDESRMDAAKLAVEVTERQFQLLSSKMVPPKGLSTEDYENAVRAFLGLPAPIRLAFVRALGKEDKLAGDVSSIPEIVSDLYRQSGSLKPQILQDSLKDVKKSFKDISMTDEANDTSSQDYINKKVLETIYEETDPAKIQVMRNVESFLPEVTRKADFPVTEEDVKILENAVDPSIFSASGRPEEIPGGYVIRGNNKKATGVELIAALDEKLPSDWACTVCYIEDPTWEPEGDLEPPKALVLLNKDFTPETTQWLSRSFSIVAFVTAVLFAVGIYGSTDAVSNRLMDLASISDTTGLSWFGWKVADFLLPLFVILASHEAGHFIVGTTQGIKTESLIPTTLPFYGNFPVFGTVTRIVNSPKNLSALFDFAIMGPLLGLISSMIFLGTGLIATQDILGTPEAQYLPAIPVSVIKLSTFSGTIVDDFFGGGGIITSQDASTPVPLHPYAIAGLCGLLINAIEMLPLGKMDGSRVAMSIFGRLFESIIQVLSFLVVVIFTFFTDGSSGELLTAALIVSSIVERGAEVPCRDESQKANAARCVAAALVWFLAALIVTPMS